MTEKPTRKERPRNIANDILDCVETATAKWTRQKKSAVRAVLDRFDAASSQAAKVKIMHEMEQLAVEEMRKLAAA